MQIEHPRALSRERRDLFQERKERGRVKEREKIMVLLVRLKVGIFLVCNLEDHQMSKLPLDGIFFFLFGIVLASRRERKRIIFLFFIFYKLLDFSKNIILCGHGRRSKRL